MTDEELRARAMSCALQYANGAPWKIETMVRWANAFFHYFKSGVFDMTTTQQREPPR